MSKVALSGNALGTGTVTLAAPNTNSTVTLNLPATAGTVLIQDGTNTTSVANLTASGNLTFTGTGNRILGDFSGASTARVMVQSSTLNGGTFLGVLPNGTSTNTSITAFSNADPTNANGIQMGSTGTEARFFVLNNGTSLAVPMTFYTGGSEAMRITTDRNVGIGTISPGNRLHVVAASQADGNGLIRAENTATTPNSATNASFVAKNYFGTSQFMQWENNGVRIGSRTTANGGSGNVIFVTGSDSESMRIDSSGNLLVGTQTTTPAERGFTVTPSAGASYINVGHINGTASGTSYATFAYNTGYIGSISQNGTTGVLYNLTSDYRLKNDPQPLTGSKDFIMALQPKKWQWWDGSGEGVGFIAHEFMEVAKYSGNGVKDAVDADGKPVYQSIQPSSSEVMAHLTNLVQEQQALIQDLTTRLTALEGN
jgi:hypothetical protein